MLQNRAGIAAVPVRGLEPAAQHPVIGQRTGDHIGLAVFQGGSTLQSGIQRHLGSDTAGRFLLLHHTDRDRHRRFLGQGLAIDTGQCCGNDGFAARCRTDSACSIHRCHSTVRRRPANTVSIRLRVIDCHSRSQGQDFPLIQGPLDRCHIQTDFLFRKHPEEIHVVVAVIQAGHIVTHATVVVELSSIHDQVRPKRIDGRIHHNGLIIGGDRPHRDHIILIDQALVRVGMITQKQVGAVIVPYILRQ